MAKKYFVSFSGGEAYRESGKRIYKEAKSLRLFNGVKLYGKRDLPKAISNSLLSLCPRGFGYWLWKPWIILDKLQKVNYGDIVVYTDCGCELHNNPEGWNEMFAHLTSYDAICMQYRAGELYPGEIAIYCVGRRKIA